MSKEKKSKVAKTDKKNSVDKEKENKELEFNKLESYPIDKAVELIKNLAKEKFDSSVEVHYRLGIDAKKGDQQIRSAVSLPHGTGKTVKVAAFVTEEKEKEVKKAGADLVGGEDLIAKIKKTEKTDFQVAVAEPAIMKNLSQIAKILGTRGLMPSPKNETVTTNPAKTVLELKKGKISFKNDDTGNIHVAIGKVSFDTEKLVDNFNATDAIIKKLKPAKTKGIYIRNISICSAMSPGVKVIISK
ncbi:50S ribosomal protein L1 [bacterium]|nr:50S ribosomal protein L1 [bacterium]